MISHFLPALLYASLFSRFQRRKASPRPVCENLLTLRITARFLTLTQIKTQKVDPSPELYQSIGSVFILFYFTKHDLQDGKCDGIMLAYQSYAWNIYEYYIETAFVCSTV